MRFRLVAGIVAASVVASPALALTFTFATYSGDTLTSDEASAFQTAANAWSSVISNNITVNLQIGFTSLPANDLGGTASAWGTTPAATLLAQLTSHETDAADARAVASLINDPISGTYALTSAQAKALGYSVASNQVDGVIQFSSNYDFSTSRNADGTIASGTYDLVGIAEHEIGHVLGFDSSYDGGTPSGDPTLLDAYRFTGSNQRATAAASSYFSINDGATNLASFSPGPSDSYQASHWLEGTGGLLDPALAQGATQNITQLDATALDVLGYTLTNNSVANLPAASGDSQAAELAGEVTTVPEPWSLALLAIGTAGTVSMRRRRG